MTLNSNELFSSNSVDAVPSVQADVIMPKEFAAGSGTLPRLAPIALNSSTKKFVPWDEDGSNDADTIVGFVWPDPIVLNATDEVLGQVMLAGRLHYDDVLAIIEDVDANYSVAGLKAALQADCRTRGLHVQGLAEVA